MLSPNLTLTVQFLKGLLATIILKKLTPRGRHRWSAGNPISSSLPRHGTRIRTKTQKIEKKKKREKKKKKTMADCKLAQKK